MRNVLVHQYHEVDGRRLLKSLIIHEVVEYSYDYLDNELHKLFTTVDGTIVRIKDLDIFGWEYIN